MKANPNLHFFLWLITILVMANASLAQSIPGRWHKVVLPQAARIGNDNTMDFSFIDSLNGICLSDNGLISSTSNGGRSWSLDTNINTSIDYKQNLNSVECTAPHRGFAFSNSETFSISPSGAQLQFPPNPNEVNYGAYFTLAEKMYDTAYGFRLAELLSTHDPGEYDDSVVIIATHDGWKSSSIYGSAYIISPDSTYTELHTQSMFTGYIVDSNNIWTAKGGLGQHIILLHTSNGGISWNSTSVSETLHSSLEDFNVNPLTREIFFLASLSPVDYAYSSNDGSTWRMDSTFGGMNLWRLTNPSHGVLWAMIGEGGLGFVEIFPPQNTFGTFYANDYSRKLGYSSDNGQTWAIDSTTFIDDSLEEMHFLDARHGWIASWSHDSLFMWYYDADASSGVVEHSRHSISYSLLYPDPASQTLMVDAPGLSGQILVVDVLGRVAINATLPVSGQTSLDIRSLLTGPYEVIIGNLTSRFVKE